MRALLIDTPARRLLEIDFDGTGRHMAALLGVEYVADRCVPAPALTEPLVALDELWIPSTMHRRWVNHPGLPYCFRGCDNSLRGRGLIVGAEWAEAQTPLDEARQRAMFL